MNPWLGSGVALEFLLGVAAIVAMVFDHRQLLGLNVWIKPLKFNLSILVTLATLAIFLGGLRRFDSARVGIAVVLTISLSVEGLLISLQALRGVRSHFNTSTPFNAAVFATMGVMFIFACLALLVTLLLYCLEKPLWSPAVTWGIRLGLLTLLAGCAEGIVMVAHGGHTVGAADGLAGLALTNWSKRHGDLRVAHFFAIHAVQAFPLLGYACSRTSLGERTQITGVFMGSALYTLCVWWLFRHAMQGRPV